jgi:iron complex transport system substrate-binding protein
MASRRCANVKRLRVAAVALLLALAGDGIASGQGTPPLRIVSTSPSITETLFALGLGDRVVGVSNFCLFPAAARTLPKVGTFLKPDPELIAGLRPDLVVIHAVSGGLDRRLNAVGLPLVAVDSGSLSSIYSSIRQVATRTNVAERGERLIGDLQRRLDVIRQAGAVAVRPRVLFVIGRRPGRLADLVAVGAGSYLDELITIVGGINVLSGPGQSPYPRISVEAVLRLDPDVIIDTADLGESEAERIRRRPINERLWEAYPSLTAVKNGRVHAATIDPLVVPGPRVVDAAEWLAAMLRAPRRQ